MKTIKCDLPEHIKGMLVKTFDDGEDYYTIVLNARLTDEQLKETYEHECRHLEECDFERVCCDEVEMLRHGC